MADAKTEFTSLVMDQWRMGNMPVREMADRIYNELITEPDLLTRLLAIATDKRCPYCHLSLRHHPAAAETPDETP